MRFATALLALAVIAAPRTAPADDVPLHTAIDDLMARDAGGLPLAIAGDSEFLRRVSIHLTGMPPAPETLRAFLDDPNPEKRTAAIDRLLTTPHFPRRMAEFLDLTFMERRANTNIPQDEWMSYLVQSTRANKPWQQYARELLTADGTDDDPRAAARFVLDRGSEPNLLTRDTSRIFFGRDMQCNQCHDHPLIDDYLQVDYHGLFAFFANGAELKIKEGDKEKVYYAEKAGGDAQFESVFVKGIKHLTGPRVMGDVEIAEPVYLPGEEYEVAPADNTRPVPKYSRRARLAELATSGTNRAFNENIANRLWALMMGRGLVHPVDLHHSSNPPTHPELLTLLGERVAAMSFDMRAFVRELALTRVYQRPYDLSPELLAQGGDPASLEAQRSGLEANVESTTKAFNTALDEWNAAQAALLPVAAELDAARARYADLLKKRDDARKAVADAEAQVTARQSLATAVNDASTKAQAAVAALPENVSLTQAAQKFAERATQLTAEIETLKQAVVDKTAAIAAPQSELDAARPLTEAAQQKTEPFRTTVRDAEKQVQDSRAAMTAAITALQAHDQQVETAKLAAELAANRVAATAAAEQVPIKQNEAVAASAAAAEYVAVVTEQLARMQSAEQKLAESNAVLSQIEQSHAQQAETTQAVASAATAASAALAKLPEDPALKQAAESLQGRASELTTALAVHQTQVDAAVAARAAQAAQVAAEQAEVTAVQQEQARRNSEVAAAQQALAAARTAADSAIANVEDAESGLGARRTREGLLAELQPMSPEELCWSIFQVTGVYDRYWQGQAAEVEKTQPLTDEIRNDAARMAARLYEIEQRTYDQLKGNAQSFATVYGNGAGQPQSDFFATADQALFVANGSSIVSWVVPSAGNVTERIIKETDAAKAAEDLYVSVLSRKPSEAEAADVAACFAKTTDRTAAAQELVWGLIASAEFRFNH